MTDQLFEIAFSGQVSDGADLETVKLHIAKIFKADAERIAQLFSGNRMIIKRAVDEATAARYRGAFEKVGAICEVLPIGEPEPQSINTVASIPSTSPAVAEVQATVEYVSRYPESDQIPQALLTEPLGVRGEEIPDLGADIAPVGSMMQYQIKQHPEPDIDITGFDIAPVGSVLTTGNEAENPPQPDTSGLTLAE